MCEQNREEQTEIKENCERQGEETQIKKPLFPVSAEGKPSVIIFITALLLIIGITFLSWAVKLLENAYVRFVLGLVLNAAFGAVAAVAVIITGQKEIIIPKKKKLWLQLLIGFGIAAVLCLFIGIIPILCGVSLVGSHSEPSLSGILLTALQLFLFVGVAEELVFRGYVQNQLSIWLKKLDWLAPLIAGVMFGCWHIINGNIFQVLLTSAIGCVFGYAKYFLKDCSLLSVTFAHGLYDFSLALLRCFML